MAKVNWSGRLMRSTLQKERKRFESKNARKAQREADNRGIHYQEAIARVFTEGKRFSS